MKKFVFAIDCDEVIRANVQAMIELYNEEFGTDITKLDVIEYDVDLSFPLIKYRLGMSASEYFFTHNAKRVFFDADVLNGAKKALETLSKYGTIYITTWQSSDANMKMTIDWLEKNGLKYDGIFFTKDKTLIHADYLIDDCPNYFHGCNCNHGIMINRPYNMSVNIKELKDDSNMKTIDRFSSLENFSEWFEKNVKIFEKFE